jgi:hypothetical protein
LISTKPKQQRQLDWQAHKVVEHWDAVEPLLAKVDKSPHSNLSTSKPSIEKKRDYQAGQPKAIRC